MKLKNFLFGNGRYREAQPTMNPGSRGNTQGGTCNMPPRNEPGSRAPQDTPMQQREQICNPYGRLLPDAEKYSKKIYDRGNDPYVFSIPEAVRSTDDYRRALWSGEHLQMLSMVIPQGEEIGIEAHEGADQLTIVWEGFGDAVIGTSPNRMSHTERLRAGSAVIIPAGYYHNIRNTSKSPMRLITVYAPMQEPYGTVQKNKPD